MPGAAVGTTVATVSSSGDFPGLSESLSSNWDRALMNGETAGSATKGADRSVLKVTVGGAAEVEATG